MNYSRYKINPVKATLQKYENEDCGIHALNDTCFGICGAFSGTNDVYNMDPDCTKACEVLINDARIKKYGVGICDHQAPYRPVLWEQVPHYFPGILNRGYEPKTARKMCLAKCQKMMPGSDECVSNCNTDFNAVVYYPKLESSIVESDTGNKKSKNNTPLYISLGVLLLLIMIPFLLRRKN